MIATIIGTHTISISNPTTSYRLSVNSRFFGYTNLFVSPFLDSGSMEVFLAVGESQANRLNMAFEAN
jgi:hypothetical protein